MSLLCSDCAIRLVSGPKMNQTAASFLYMLSFTQVLIDYYFDWLLFWLTIVLIGCCFDWLLFWWAVVLIGCCFDWLLQISHLNMSPFWSVLVLPSATCSPQLLSLRHCHSQELIMSLLHGLMTDISSHLGLRICNFKKLVSHFKIMYGRQHNFSF